MADKRGVFRVNYYDQGQPKTGYVAAFSDVEAASFLGVASQSGVQVTKALFPVEVAGTDTPHDTIPSSPVNVAPFELAKSVSRDDFNALQAQVADLVKQLNAKNTPASPAPKS